eukprot:15359674-Ditylum_brightwellii.AAC.1
MRRATENTFLIASYIRCKTSTARVFLPHGYQTLHDGLDNDHPVGNIQTNLTGWITSETTTSNL